MNLLDLFYYIDIVEIGSISEAARCHYISQQSMSTHLKKLEEEYGVALAVRGTPLRMTPEGERLYKTAKKIRRLLDDFEDSLRDKPGVLSIGFELNDTPPFFSELLAFIEKETGKPLKVQTWLDCKSLGTIPEEIELFLFTEAPAADFDCVTLLHTRSAVVASAGLLRSVYGAADTEEIIRRVGEGDGGFLSEIPFALAERSGFPDWILANAVEIKSSQLMNTLCENGKCARILPEDAARMFFGGNDEILIMPLPESFGIGSLGIYYRRKKILSPAAKTFISCAKVFFSQKE